MPKLINGVKAVGEQNFYLLKVTEVRITTKKGLKHNKFQALDFAFDRVILFHHCNISFWLPHNAFYTYMH